MYVYRLLSVRINVTLKAINLQTVRHHELPDCYDFHIMVGDMSQKTVYHHEQTVPIVMFIHLFGGGSGGVSVVSSSMACFMFG